MEHIMDTVEKKNTKRGKKAVLIVLIIIACIALISVLFINIVTRPSIDTEPHHAVGGMVYSNTVDYQSSNPAAKGIRHNPVVRVMQMVWRFCEDGDKAKHAEQTPPTDIVKNVDIPYIDDGNIYHKFDIYYPEGADVSSLPVIIDIHGGGWIYGDKELNEYYCLELAHKGYAVFNISYRLVPDVTVVEQVQDCAAALKYINENCKDYNLDSVLLTGDSAGGMLAAYSAALLRSPELRDAFGAVDGGLDVDALLLTSPVAYMKNGGYFSVYTKVMWGKGWNTANTVNLMDLNEILTYTDLPPAYLITSGGDALAHDQTQKAYRLLQDKGIKSEIADFGDDENGKALPHVFSVLFPFDKSGQEAIDGGLAFYQEVLGN